MLARRYRNIRKAIDDDPLLFQDEIFNIEPASGQIWPNSEMTITVSFRPTQALSYSCVAYCNITCSEERLSLHLSGEGIGPKALLSVTDWDLGDIYITESVPYDITIENRGEIPAEFELLPNDSPFGSLFEFGVHSGILGVGERLNFKVTFTPDKLGEFDETFKFALKGSTEMLTLHFSGHVVAPKFKFDPEIINYGKVSLTFEYPFYITLTNISTVKFSYNLRIPGDGRHGNKEFDIKPARDTLDRGEERKIEIVFTPYNYKPYDMVLVIDIDRVGHDMHSIPIKAVSDIPHVRVENSRLEFGEVFLRHRREKTVKLLNSSDLKAKFRIKPQAEEHKMLATYTTDRDGGEIGPEDDVTIAVTLTTKKLGPIVLPLSVEVVGAPQPLLVNILAFSKGPEVELSEKELDFGNVDVLRDWTKSLVISNKSPINADFHIFTKNKNSIFKPLIKHGELAQEESLTIPIVCNADDKQKFNDTLHIVIKDGVDKEVALRARGIGSTIFCKEDLKNINFGVQYTFRNYTREIFVENKGRKPQKLTWQRKKALMSKSQREEAKEKEKQKKNGDEPEADPDGLDCAFTIVPDTINLPAKTGIMFQFRANSIKTGKIAENFELSSQALNERKTEKLMTTVIEGEFINPTLVFNEKLLYFKYSWEKGEPFHTISKNLEITCACQLPTNFILKAQSPFSISQENFSLLPGKTTTLKVDFDPGLKYDRVSDKIKSKLQVIHVDHPFKQAVDLVGEVCFPNLKFERNAINFGSILNDTSKRVTIQIQNISEMPLYYEWSFVDEEVVRERRADEKSMIEDDPKKKRKGREGAERNVVPINEIFDILPMNGTLAPGETEAVEFVFHAILGQKVKTMAVCAVDGGPEYEVQLTGDSSEMTYRITPGNNTLDFGEAIPFNDWETREFVIENTGKVAYDFSIDSSSLYRRSLIDISPLSGRINGFEKQKIQVRLCPGIPDIINEQFAVNIAHFEPEIITCIGYAIYPALAMNLPRSDPGEYLKVYETEKINTSEPGFPDPSHSELRQITDTLQVTEFEVEVDRKLFCDMIIKSLHEYQAQAAKDEGEFKPDKTPKGSAHTPLRSAGGDRKSELHASQEPFQLKSNELYLTEEARLQGLAKFIMPKTNMNTRHLDPRIYERATLTAYQCDFGNIVIGASKNRSFKIMNTSVTPISFSFDQKYKALGIWINPDKVPKLMPGDSIKIDVKFTARKTLKFGQNKMYAPIEVKNGPRYNVELIANLTIPEITLATDTIEFQKVIIGQRKTIFMRFENNKEVACEWSLSTRADLVSGPDKGDASKFTITPSSGKINPGQKQMIEFTFAPSSEKQYNHKFVIVIKENPKLLNINVKGQGANVALEFIPEKIGLKPIKPYDNKCYTRLDVRNPSDYDVELYSLNFDTDYAQEEEILRNFDELTQNELLYYNVRAPGQPFWEKIRKAYNIKMKKNQFEKRIKDLGKGEETAEARAAIQKELDDFLAANYEEPEKIYPRKVDEALKHHVVIFGPEGCGKTQLAKHLSKVQQRGILNCDQLLQWNREQKTEAAAKADAFLEQKQKELEAVIAEREKNKKKRKKGEEEPPLNEPSYKWLPPELLEELLVNNLTSPEYNAGVIFDNLVGENIEKVHVIIKVILKVLKNHAIQLINLYYPTEEADPSLGVTEIIDPYRVSGLHLIKEEISPPQSPTRAEEKKKTSKTSKAKTTEKSMLTESKTALDKKKDASPVMLKSPSKRQTIDKKQTSQASIKMGSLNEEPGSPRYHHAPVDEKPIFEVNYPRPISSEEYEAHRKLAKDVADLFLEQYKEPPKEEEVKREPTPGKTGKGAPPKKGDKKPGKQEPVVEEKKEEVKEPELPQIEILKVEPKKLVERDRKYVIELPIIYNHAQLNNTVIEYVPEPIFPDPDKEPVPDPVFHQILKKPQNRPKYEAIKHFSIHTPIGNYVNEDDSELVPADVNIEEHTEKKARWIIPAKKKITLYIKFFTTVPGNYESILDFESFYSTKSYKVPCMGVCDFPMINPNPINVFMNNNIRKVRPEKAPECYLSRKFVTSEQLFDFGPLLIGKDPLKKNDLGVININSFSFRITNYGKFDCDVSFALASSVINDNPEYRKNVFSFEPEKLQLSKDETKEVRVWAIPDITGKFRDDLICMVKDNPVPTIFPMICSGQTPTLQIDTDKITFDRLLINSMDTKTLTITNKCAIPVKWQLVAPVELPKGFNIKKTTGLLLPNREEKVIIEFTALAQQKFLGHKIILYAEDDEGLGKKQEPKTIELNAEAFEIKVSLFNNQNPEHLLDFGAVRVGDQADQVLPIKNIGLYPIQYRFIMKDKFFKSNFTIEPMEGMIDANQEQIVRVMFRSKEEVELRTYNETAQIGLEILEGKTLESHHKVMINVKVVAKFSKYSIIPVKNINFGPIAFNDKKTREFEIRNEGMFEFNFTIFDYFDDVRRNEAIEEEQKMIRDIEEARIAALALQQSGKAGKKDAKKDAKKAEPQKKDTKKDPKKGADPYAGQLAVGQWRIDPPNGTVLPNGGSQPIKVTFLGQGQQLYEQKLGIHVTRRDPNDQPKGILYEVVAESCIPGIVTENYEAIFEEQIVIPSMAAYQKMAERIESRVFSVEEKCFYFGTVVPGTKSDKGYEGIREKFKIINNNKIACNVTFEVKQKKNQSSNELFAFTVEPKEIKINPHTYEYVRVTFNPQIMASYAGVFEATVKEGESNPKTHKLTFDLRGEGALPTLKIDKPNEFMDGVPVLRFPKTRLGKTQLRSIMLKNDGQIPATVKFEFPQGNEHFRFLDQNTFTVSQKSYQSFNVEFRPRAVGKQEWSLFAETDRNKYERAQIKVVGEGFQEDLVFEGLPNGLEDEIVFGDCVRDQSKTIEFWVKNNSNDTLRFVWSSPEDFTFAPRVGHLPPQGRKRVVCTFKSSVTIKHAGTPLECQLQSIKKESKEDWDDTFMTEPRYVTKNVFDWYTRKREEEEKRRREEEEALKPKKGGKKEAKPPQKKTGKGVVEEVKEEQPPLPDPNEDAIYPLSDPIKEPEYVPVEKSERMFILKAQAVADYVRYESEFKEIFFAPTLMYTSRMVKFKLKNLSSIQANYTNKIARADTGVKDSGYFTVTPKEGSIPPGGEEEITVRFAPREVEDDNERLLVFKIDNLDPSLPPLVIELNGEADRPVCHFELPPSDYRERKGQEIAHVDSKYNIIDFESIGTKVRNTKKFYVINPTNMGYEFVWRKEEESDGKGGNYSSFFKCLTEKGVVLSGKKFEMVFEYTPDLVGTHESYWTFEIPEKGLSQKFYIVGNVNEPNVFFNVGSHDFGLLLINAKNSQVVKLTNLEHIPFQFSFDRDSIRGEHDYGNSLSVSPMTGVVNPNSEVPIEITFCPKIEDRFNYNLACNIKQKSRPINLNVKGIGYFLHQNVFLEHKSTPLNSKEEHLIDFGDIFINETKTRVITIENLGKFNFDYVIQKKYQSSMIQINKESGTVSSGRPVDIELSFFTNSEFRLRPKTHWFVLNIVSGPSYTFRLNGSARRPNVEFSFTQYDFGPCYVLKQPLAVSAILEIKNVDSSTMTVESLYEKTNYLDVQLAPGQVIFPKDSLKVPIYFTPRELKRYEETIRFDINNLNKIDVKIRGEGAPMRLELERADAVNLDFGIFRVNQSETRSARLINYGRKGVKITLDVEGQRKNLKEKYNIKIRPKGEVFLNPRDAMDVQVTFAPKTRIHQFKHELFYQIVGNKDKYKLLNLSGSCHGIELKLLADTAGFGPVVIGSKSTKEVTAVNLGDINAKFQWDTTFCKDYFTIYPERGIIPAHEDLHFQVTFHPNVTSDEISFPKVACYIQDSDPLFLNLIGKCIDQKLENIKEIKLETKVRVPKVEKITVPVKNPSAKEIRIKAQISANSDVAKGFFQGKDVLVVPPNAQSAVYELTYRPLSMTKHASVPSIKTESHEGSLFFPLPDGDSLLYNLVGFSLPPDPTDLPELKFKAKEPALQVISMKNWLKTTQRFKVAWTVDNNDPAVLINGPNYVDVMGEATKEVKMKIRCMKPGNYKASFTFLNEQTNEYVVYRQPLVALPPDTQGKIEFQSVVREEQVKILTIENPLSKKVEFKEGDIVCDNDQVIIMPKSLTIDKESVRKYRFLTLFC